MFTVYMDESGYTGQDLLNADQPVFVHVSNALSDDEVAALYKEYFAGTQARLAGQYQSPGLIRYQSDYRIDLVLRVIEDEVAAKVIQPSSTDANLVLFDFFGGAFAILDFEQLPDSLGSEGICHRQ